MDVRSIEVDEVVAEVAEAGRQRSYPLLWARRFPSRVPDSGCSVGQKLMVVHQMIHGEKIVALTDLLTGVSLYGCLAFDQVEAGKAE